MSRYPAIVLLTVHALGWPALAAARPAPPEDPASTCTLDAADAEWMTRALADWGVVRQGDLTQAQDGLPWLVLFDGTCAWQRRPGASEFSGAPHGGRVSLPDESSTDVRVKSFAATYGLDDKPFVVMALPSLWRQDPSFATQSALDRLTRSVFVHEMTHTLQAHHTGVVLNNLQTQFALPANLTDDVIQERFGVSSAFQSAYEHERDLLFEAAAERDDARRRTLATRALDMLAARRAVHFADANLVYARLEDLFLDMEGLANWAGYRVALKEIGNAPDAVRLMRGSGTHWSQDEGLALFLVLDALVPRWQDQILGPAERSATDLLSTALH